MTDPRGELLSLARDLPGLASIEYVNGPAQWRTDDDGIVALCNALIERCAAVCDKVGESDDPDDDNCARQVRSLAFAIRRMKAPTP